MSNNIKLHNEKYYNINTTILFKVKKILFLFPPSCPKQNGLDGDRT